MKRPPRADWRTVIEDAVARSAKEQRALKQDRSRRRRAAITEAAVHVFARDGVARARIHDIAALAGVPVASIYGYFRDKQELAYAVPVLQQTEFYAEFGEQSKRLDSCRELLTHFLWLTTDFARRHADWARTLYLEVWPSVLVTEARVRHVLDDYGRIAVGLIVEGAERREWPRQPDPYQTATIFIGSINQLIITWLLYRRPRDLIKAAPPMIERLMHVLDKPAPARPGRRVGQRPATRRSSAIRRT